MQFHSLFSAPPLLQLCDWLRDEALVELGVKLEDKKGEIEYMVPCAVMLAILSLTGRTVIKLVGKEALLKEREAEKQVS